MNTYLSCCRLAALVTATLLSGTPAMTQSSSISTEYLLTVYLPKEPGLAVDSSLVISRDSAGGWVRVR